MIEGNGWGCLNGTLLRCVETSLKPMKAARHRKQICLSISSWTHGKDPPAEEIVSLLHGRRKREWESLVLF